MNVVASVVIPRSSDVVHLVVDDLLSYPKWLDIVRSVEPDGVGAWQVVLQARLGPLARSKKLRMVRTVLDAESVAFERHELDGRSHGMWRLKVSLVYDAVVSTTGVTMQLEYAGSLFGPLMEPVLQTEINKAKGRLVALVSAL